MHHETLWNVMHTSRIKKGVMWKRRLWRLFSQCRLDASLYNTCVDQELGKVVESVDNIKIIDLVFLLMVHLSWHHWRSWLPKCCTET